MARGPRQGGGRAVAYKGDADVVAAPLQRRPITLLPTLYRLWAHLRQRWVAAWRAGWDPAMALRRWGAEGQAWLLAWDAELAHARGQPFVGVAADFSKCFDSVRLGLLRRALAAARWAPPIGKHTSELQSQR